MFTRHHKTTFITSAWPNAGKGMLARDEKSAEGERGRWNGHKSPDSLIGAKWTQKALMGSWTDLAIRRNGHKRPIAQSHESICYWTISNIERRFLKQLKSQFCFILFKSNTFIFYQQLQNVTVIYLLVPSASQESLILLGNIQVPSREEEIVRRWGRVAPMNERVNWILRVCD